MIGSLDNYTMFNILTSSFKTHAKRILWLAAIFFAVGGSSVFAVTINQGGGTSNSYCSSFATGIAMQSYLEPFTATSSQITGTVGNLSNVSVRFSLKFTVDQATSSTFTIEVVPQNYYGGGSIVEYTLSPQDIADLNATNDYIIFEKQFVVGGGIGYSGYSRYFYPPTSNNGGFGPASYSIGFYSNVNTEKCTYADGSNLIYYAIGIDGLTPLPSETQFTDIQPVQDYTFGTNSVEIGATLYRASDYGVYFDEVCYEVEQLDFYGSALPWNECLPASFSGYGDFTATTTLADGIYNMIWYLWSESEGIKALATSSQFTVVQNTVGSYNEILNQFGGASTTPTSLSDCVASSTSNLNESFVYAYTKCLFMPQTGTMGALVTSFKNDILRKFPWGYGTRIYDLLYNATSSATTTLPSIAFTMPSNMPVSGSFDFSPWQPIAEVVAELETATTSTMEGTVMDNFLFYWNTLWYIVFGLWLMREIYGTWNDVDLSKSTNNVGNKIDY